MIRFLHIGDVHLNKTFATKNHRLRKRLKNSIIESFNNAVQFCIHKRLDALLIAGDLFDNNELNLIDKQIVKDAFRKLNEYDINVYYASGNHDFTSYTSEIRKIDFPNNVFTYFDENYEIHDLVDKDTDETYHIIGCGHSHKHESRNLIENFPVASINKTIGLVHSMVESRLTIGDEGNYLPSTIQTLSSKGYEYFALGHIHKNGFIDKNEKIYYSGSLQGLSSKESGIKGGYFVTLDNGVVNAEHIELASMKWLDLTIALSDEIESFDLLYDYIVQKVKSKCEGEVFSKLSLEIKLKGRTRLYHELKDEKKIEEIYETIVDQLSLFNIKITSKEIKTCYDKSDYMGKKSVLGKILEESSNMKKTNFVPELDFLHLKDEEYLKELLDEMDENIMDYFLEGFDEN